MLEVRQDGYSLLNMSEDTLIFWNLAPRGKGNMKHLECANTEGSLAILNCSVQFSSHHWKIITSCKAIGGFIFIFARVLSEFSSILFHYSDLLKSYVHWICSLMFYVFYADYLRLTDGTLFWLRTVRFKWLIPHAFCNKNHFNSKSLSTMLLLRDILPWYIVNKRKSQDVFSWPLQRDICTILELISSCLKSL